MQPVMERIEQEIRAGSTLLLVQPVYYEVLRGLLKVGATRKQRVFEEVFVPQLEWKPLTDEDWAQAAQFWADARRAGRQFSDVDLLVAAVTIRLDGVLVSANEDFDALPVTCQNWREPTS